MKFLPSGTGELVLEELSKASEAYLAVTFFNPDAPNALRRVPKLKVIVSEEYAVTNPFKLEELQKDALRSIPPDREDGKLHAKVFIAKRQNGSFWVLPGSANLTRHRADRFEIVQLGCAHNSIIAIFYRYGGLIDSLNKGMP